MSKVKTNHEDQDYDGVKTDLEMLHEITAYGTRKACDRQTLINRLNAWVVDMNIKRMIKYGLIEEVEKDGTVIYRVPDHIFKAHYS